MTEATVANAPDGSDEGEKPAPVSATDPRRRPAPTDVVALTVHGVGGVVDLVVPEAAHVRDVLTEYGSVAGATAPTSLATRLGRLLPPDLSLEDAGLGSGAVVVALGGSAASAAGTVDTVGTDAARGSSTDLGGPASAAWFTVVAAIAVLGGWCASGLPDGTTKDVAVGLLGGAGFLGCLPVGRWARHRAVAAPALVGAAAFVVAWSPEPERLPTVIGVAALAAAVAAAVARALDEAADEALRVWIVTGIAGFLVSTACALAGAAPQVVYAVLLTAAMLAARFVPAVAVDVPDQYLIDLERLAVTAWSARERPAGRRGRIIVPRPAVAMVAERGTRMVTATAAAVLVVVTVCVPLLLQAADLPIDRIGARCLVGFAGASLLLAARSYRHAAARALLRAAGLVCLVALAVVLLSLLGPLGQGWVIAGCAGLGALLVVVAVALGRGWRSAWWARRAEVAEGLTGAFALGAVVVAVGLFRYLWELTS